MCIRRRLNALESRMLKESVGGCCPEGEKGIKPRILTKSKRCERREKTDQLRKTGPEVCAAEKGGGIIGTRYT